MQLNHLSSSFFSFFSLFISIIFNFLSKLIIFLLISLYCNLFACGLITITKLFSFSIKSLFSLIIDLTCRFILFLFTALPYLVPIDIANLKLTFSLFFLFIITKYELPLLSLDLNKESISRLFFIIYFFFIFIL